LILCWASVLVPRALAAPPELTREQQERLKERERREKEAENLRLAGLYARLARQCEEREDWAEARRARQGALEVLAELHDAKDWRVTDARLALAHAERLARLDKGQRQRLREAEAMDARVKALADQGKQRAALTLAQRALAARKELLGEDDALTLESLDRLRSLHQDLGDLVKAEPLLRKAIELRKRLLGEGHPDYPRALDDLARLYVGMAQHPRAEALYRQALEVRRRTLGDKHPDCAEAQKRLADFYEKWVDKVLNGSDAGAAVLAAERRLAFQRESLGGPPEMVINSLMLLARIHEYAEDFAAAEKAHRERLTLLIKLRGENHPQVGDARFALSHVRRLAKLTPDQRRQLQETELLRRQATELAREGKYTAALEPARQALETRKAILGEKAPQYADSLVTVASLYQGMKDYPKAEPLLRQALEIRKASPGENHPVYARSLERLAALYTATGDYARAEPLYRRALEIGKVAYGETGSGYTSTLADFASMLEGWAKQLTSREDFAAARKVRQELLAIRTRLHGGQHWQTTDARLALAYVERLARLPADQRRRLAEADRLHERAMDLARQGKDDQALPLARRGAEVRKELLGEDDPRHAATLYLLGALLGRKGDTARALATTRQAAAILKKTLGETHPSTIACLYNLGRLYQRTGDYIQAEALLQRALALHKEVLGEKDPTHLDLLDALADLYIDTGDYARAETLCQRAQALREEAMTAGYSDRVRDLGIQQFAVRYEVGGGKHADYVRGLERLARVYKGLGQFDRAEPLLREVRNLRSRDPGEKHPDYALALNNLGTLYSNMGDHTRAEPLYRQALEILRQAPGDHRHAYAGTCNNLARLYYQTGEYDRALPLYQEALQGLGQAGGKGSLDYATALDNLALLHADREEYAKAEELYQQALQVKKHAVGEKHPSYAISLNNLGELYQAQGDLARAEPLFRQALEVYQTALEEKHPEYILTLHNLALLYWQRGDHARAEPLMPQAVEVSVANLALAATVQSERQQFAMSQMLRDRLDAYLTLAPLAKQSGEAAYRHVLAWKGSVLLRQRRLRLMRQNPEFTTTRLMGVGKDKDGKEVLLIGTEASKFEELEAVTSRLATLAFAVPDPAQQEARRRQIEALTEYKEELEAELARVGETFRQELELTRLTPAGVRALLPADTVLVDFLEHTHSRPLPKGGWKKERRLAAFVVRRDRPVAQLDLGPVQPIAGAVAAWRKSISQGRGVGPDGPAADLRRLVWDRLATHVQDARVVLVSPDGAVARLPFAALPGKEPGSYLIEERAVAVLPVPQLLPELLKQAAPAGKPSLLLVGDVDFNAAPGAPTPAESLLDKVQRNGARETTGSGVPPPRQSPPDGPQPPRPGNSDTAPATAATPRSAPRGGLRQWPALAGTGAEVAAIRESFRKGFGPAPVHELRGKEPTEDAIRQQAPKHRYLHFATHGFFAPPTLRSALATASRAERPTGAELFARAGVAGFHPGVLSGLVLAGANRPGGPAEDDGILTALEMAAIDLGGVELATLSACETGLGEEAGGEGLLGLQRAFQAAGARSVVSGLWKVDDDATQALMREFYRQLWEEKRGKLAALRQAQVAMLRRYDPAQGRLRGVGGTAPDAPPRPAGGRLPPLYWAAFSLSGDWR
jgi:tetratricopeptide (TPR) repeat protein/CHAT domain-containing protein